MTIKLFRKQGNAFLCEKQYILVCCGVQSGKTYLGATWARNKIDKFPKNNGLISAPTYKILEQSTLDKFFTLFPELRNFYKAQKNVIELPQGGHIYIRSADQPLGLEGMTIHWGWLDEYGQAPRLAWTVCRSRVSTTKGQLMITTTPYAMNWLYQEVYQPWVQKEVQDVGIFTWPSIVNPFFDKEHAESEKRRLSPEEYRRRYEGEFTRMEGLVYGDFTSDLIVKPFGFIPIRSIGGIDFGYTNPAAILVINKNADGNYYVTDEYYETNKTQEELNQQCLFYQKKRNINCWYPDIAEPDRIQSMRNAGLICKEEKKDLTGGIDKVRALFREKRLFVFDHCVNLVDELQTYHYEEKFDEKEEPVKEHNHACDALRYALAGEQGIGSAEFLDNIIQKTDIKIGSFDIEENIKFNEQFQDQDAWKY